MSESAEVRHCVHKVTFFPHGMEFLKRRGPLPDLTQFLRSAEQTRLWSDPVRVRNNVSQAISSFNHLSELDITTRVPPHKPRSLRELKRGGNVGLTTTFKDIRKVPASILDEVFWTQLFATVQLPIRQIHAAWHNLEFDLWATGEDSINRAAKLLADKSQIPSLKRLAVEINAGHELHKHTVYANAHRFTSLSELALDFQWTDDFTCWQIDLQRFHILRTLKISQVFMQPDRLFSVLNNLRSSVKSIVLGDIYIEGPNSLGQFLGLLALACKRKEIEELELQGHFLFAWCEENLMLVKKLSLILDKQANIYESKDTSDANLSNQSSQLAATVLSRLDRFPELESLDLNFKRSVSDPLISFQGKVIVPPTCKALRSLRYTRLMTTTHRFFQMLDNLPESVIDFTLGDISIYESFQLEETLLGLGQLRSICNAQRLRFTGIFGRSRVTYDMEQLIQVRKQDGRLSDSIRFGAFLTDFVHGQQQHLYPLEAYVKQFWKTRRLGKTPTDGHDTDSGLSRHIDGSHARVGIENDFFLLA
ncbi:hypothetical protein MMC25_006780 [Agyrium rufum]|nr:hypothetical protein [Agyrium rufum]